MSLFSSFSPSMVYLITKMLVFLVLAGLIGLFIGWAISKIGQQNSTRRIEREWRRTIAPKRNTRAWLPDLKNPINHSMTKTIT